MADLKIFSMVNAMPFEPAGKYLFQAAKTFHLSEQALSGVVCEESRKVIETHYQDHAEHWVPIKFESHTLTIQAAHSSASSALYMHQHDVLERIQAEELPAVVRELKIVRR